MPNIELKQTIQNALLPVNGQPLAKAATILLETLGYKSDKRMALTPNTAAQFQSVFDPENRLNVDKALLSEWRSVDLLFQITDEEIQGALQGQAQLFTKQKVDGADINSYLFFAVGLKGNNYSRTQLATATREINKLFPMPAMVLFHYNQTLTLAIITRRLNKRDASRDVLEKVTLIKDISTLRPHRAHIEILHDLSIAQLVAAYPFSNFVELQRAWEKTLDTSELNKKFYREVSDWYFWAVRTVKFPESGEEDAEKRNATNVIRLITRLIFVWFIKEKGLVPDDLFDPRRLKELMNYSDPQKSTYYKAILQNLFFATLNTEMGEGRRFRGKNKNPNGLDAHHGISTVYRYEDYFNDSKAALNLFAGIPFLNGGLFECLDKREEKILVDGFSDDPRNQPVIPDTLFFGEEHTEDLSEIYGDARRSHEKVRGLIHIFNSYKFTIEENTPVEEEIALDPELLGKVFENLLAAYNPETGTTARKQTGSFYTPREIVNYMVDEALIAYLETALKGNEGQKAKDGDRLRQLLAYTPAPPAFTDTEKTQLIAAIDNVKVLDPAAGSGAFPMGVLHKLVFLLAKLDPDNSRWSELQRHKAIRETEEVYKIGNHDERRERLLDIEEAFENNASDYGRKLYLIENCIYGVDIQPIAVQIAKLRFFISLVVDQNIDKKKSNLGIRPLPNLETKFVAANTLIGIDEPETQKDTAISFGDHLIRDKRAELKMVRHKIFSDRRPENKRKHREQDKQLRVEIASLLNADWGKETAQQLADWDPYNQNAHAGFFDPEWMFGIEGGFDVVVGNPPYVGEKGNKAIFREIKAGNLRQGGQTYFIIFFITP
jgi:adenine-specific DNA-methyltransferase